MKCSVYVASSLDGFIAGPDDNIEWLHRPEYSAAELVGLTYDEFISTIDAIVLGRNSYEKVLTFDEWYYGDMEVIVLTSRSLEIPKKLKEKVRRESGTPGEIVARLEKEGKKHLYVDGGITVQRFLKAGLIDELTITRIPIILGKGIPLFGDDGPEIPLELIVASVSDNGFVQERYRVLKER